MLLLRMALLCAALASMPTAVLAQKAAPKDALIYIILPENGDTVRGAFWCRFGLRNMGVGPANSEFPNVGHHHLLIDTKEPIIPDEAIPHDKKHLHFGGGETEALLDLPPGKHTLQLVLSDSEHISFNPPLLSKRITIMVKGEDEDESENVSRRPKHRADHRTHRSRSASNRRERKQVEQLSKSGQEECPYQGLMRLFKNCQEATAAAAAPTKPPSTE